ncbi:hypothetical protein D3C86_2243530 [compost metagenome]
MLSLNVSTTGSVFDATVAWLAGVELVSVGAVRSAVINDQAVRPVIAGAGLSAASVNAPPSTST